MNRGLRNILWGALIVLVLAAIGVILAWFFTHRPMPVDQLNCRRDGATPAHSIILIDQSDPFNSDDRLWVDKELDDAARELPRYSRATLLGLTRTPYQLAGSFRRCTPGSPNDVNELTDNRGFIEVEWRERFYEPMRLAAEEIMRDAEEPRSPIIEALETIADRADFTPQQQQRRIVIVSDMVQNSEGFSFLESGISWSAFQRTPLYRALPELRGVEIEVHIVPRRGSSIPPERIRAFWRHYADATHASLEFDRNHAEEQP